MVDRSRVKQFVVDELGCGCPDEVFATIDIRRDGPRIGDVPLDVWINIGNRLLVYVVDARALREPAMQLATLVEAGLAEREQQRCNRFRLVVVAGDVAATQLRLNPLFERLASVDERTHLHVVTRDQVAALSTV